MGPNQKADSREAIVARMLARPDQLHGMAASEQALDQPADGHGHSIDLGAIGFRDDADPQPTQTGVGKQRGRDSDHAGTMAGSRKTFMKPG